jgi:carbon monoxide dehydrogenase subunit G
MEMSGEYRIQAPREAVWAALNDPEVLRASLPGCEEVTKESDTAFAAKVQAKVGPVKARFSGKMTLSDIDPPNGYRLSGEGQGGAAGFARGDADVRLEADGDTTVLRYTVNAHVGGKLAQIGSRLIDGTAKKLAGEFFGKFAETVEAAQGAPAEAAVAEAAAPTAPAPPQPAPAGLSPRIWVPILIAVVALILYLVAL